MHLQHEFENYMRIQLPQKLNLSPSKQVACEMIFYHFSDYAKELATKSPDEFKYFFDNFKDRIDRIAKWRCPRTHKIAPKLAKDKTGFTDIAKTKEGNTVYTMLAKPKDELSPRGRKR